MKPIRKIFHRLNLAYQAFRYGEVRPESAEELRTITEEEISEIKEFFPMPKYFVFGHARSGTTLLARLLRVHPDVHCNWQTHFFTKRPFLEDLVSSPKIRKSFSEPSNRWNRGVDFSPLALRVVCDYLLERDAREMGKSVVGDKSPNSIVDGGAVVRLHRIYPDGSLIFIIRDGRDTAISHRFLNFIEFPQFLSERDLMIRDEFAADPEKFLNGDRSIFTPEGLRKAAKNWVNNVHETHHLGKQYFQNQYHSLRFEDLIADPFQEMVKIWNFLGVDISFSQLKYTIEKEIGINPDEEWQKQKADHLISNLEKGKKGSWRELFTHRDREIFQSIAGSELSAWNYVP